MKDLQQMDLIWVHRGLVQIELRMHISKDQEAKELVDIEEGKYFDSFKLKSTKYKDYIVNRVFAVKDSIVVVFPFLEYLKFANVCNGICLNLHLG